MLRLSECINEGFFGNGYDRYKKKVLDALASVGIVIDDKKMSRAEKWIRDYYVDKMDAYKCASAVREEINKNPAIREAFEKFATEIIDSAPSLQKKRALKRIKAMSIQQKDEFDAILLKLSEIKNISAKEVAMSHGYDIMKLIQDGYLKRDEIIDRVGRQILGQRRMSVEEALVLIKEAGKEVDDSETLDWMEQAKKELIKLGYGPVTANSYVADEWKADFIQNFKDGYTPKEAAESLNRFLEEQERDES